jgi:hypothetical protein
VRRWRVLVVLMSHRELTSHTERSIRSVLRSQSTSDQRSAHSSPRRAPIMMANMTIGPRSLAVVSAARSISARVCSVVGILQVACSGPATVASLATLHPT